MRAGEVGLGWVDDLLFDDDPDGGGCLDDPLLVGDFVGDFVGDAASDEVWWSASRSCEGWFLDGVLKSFFIPG